MFCSEQYIVLIPLYNLLHFLDTIVIEVNILQLLIKHLYFKSTSVNLTTLIFIIQRLGPQLAESCHVQNEPQCSHVARVYKTNQAHELHFLQSPAEVFLRQKHQLSRSYENKNKEREDALLASLLYQHMQSTERYHMGQVTHTNLVLRNQVRK